MKKLAWYYYRDDSNGYSECKHPVITFREASKYSNDILICTGQANKRERVYYSGRPAGEAYATDFKFPADKTEEALNIISRIKRMSGKKYPDFYDVLRFAVQHCERVIYNCSAYDYIPFKYRNKAAAYLEAVKAKII